MGSYRRTCTTDDRDINDNRYTKKGVGNTAIVLGGVALGLEVLHGIWDMVRSGRRSEAEAYCRQQTAAANGGAAVGLETILPALMAYMGTQSNGNGKNGMTCADELAQVKAERYADGIGLDLYKNLVASDEKQNDRNNGLFREGFDAIAKLDKEAAVAAAVGECQRQGIQKDIERLQDIVGQHSVELCDLQKSGAVTAERLKALALAQKEGDERNREEFWAGLKQERAARHCWEEKADMRFDYEKEARIRGDIESRDYADCNFVRNVKRLDAREICPDVVTEIEYLRGLANYYQAGGKDPAIVPSERVCCPK